MMNFAIDYKQLPYVLPGDTLALNRISWRSELVLAQQRSLIQGKRVLDLACNRGWFSYACLALGASSVTGVEVRQELIDQGKEWIERTEFASRTTFIKADVFEYLTSLSIGQFDVIICLGFLYHTVRQVDFFRHCSRLQPTAIFIDTNVAKNYLWFGRQNFGKPPALFLESYEDPKLTRNTIDSDGIVFWPTTSFLEAMLQRIGYQFRRIDYRRSGITNWRGMMDYRRGLRASYVAVKDPSDWSDYRV